MLHVVDMSEMKFQLLVNGMYTFVKTKWYCTAIYFKTATFIVNDICMISFMEVAIGTVILTLCVILIHVTYDM